MLPPYSASAVHYLRDNDDEDLLIFDLRQRPRNPSLRLRRISHVEPQPRVSLVSDAAPASAPLVIAIAPTSSALHHHTCSRFLAAVPHCHCTFARCRFAALVVGPCSSSSVSCSASVGIWSNEWEGGMEPPQTASRGAEALLHLSPGSSISVAYHPLFGAHDDLIFLELDDKLLPDVLHERVVLRGQPEEDAVLCTQSKTYAMKFVGTSNSVLLVPPANQSESYQNPQKNNGSNDEEKVIAPVIKVVPGYMELVEVAPRLDKLKLLLSQNPYRLEEYDVGNPEESQATRTGLYNWKDLIGNIQASDEELRSGLQALSAVEINSYWRLVDESYMHMILEMLLRNSVLNDWSLNSLNEGEVVNMLESDGFPAILARHCLHVYGKEVEDSTHSCVWKLDEKRVCVHFARQILRAGKRKLESFMDEWRQRTPEEMQPTFDLLEGEVLTERVGVETWVRAFSVSSLPSTPAERFSILFRERPKWEWKDLQPYIRDLNVPGLSSEGLLLKFTRRTQPSPESEPVFCAR